jgi:diguanylate cyclase (GGDEF)-like protein
MKSAKTSKSNQLRRMIRTVIALMTAMPLVAFLYLFNYNAHNQVPTEVLLTSGTIIIMGWIVILDLLLLHMLKLHVKSQAALEKMQEKGMLEEPHIKSGVESLETVFTTLSSRVKESFEELKEMSSKIETLNTELAKKMNTLLTIMQIHEIYTSGKKEEEIFKFILQKMREMLKLSKIELILEGKSKNFGFALACQEDGREAPRDISKPELSLLSQLTKTTLIDTRNNDRSVDFLKNVLKAQNIFVTPLELRDDVVGFLVGGNNLNGFYFSREDLDLINIFSKNIILLWEHKKLSHAVEGLEIYDSLTGLYNKKHLGSRLEEEIKRAILYQRPCGLLLAEISNLAEIKEKYGVIETEKALKETAKIFKDILRPIDIPARTEENQIAAILIERNRRQCQTVAKKVQEVFEGHFKNNERPLTFKFSVGETPIDGQSAEELLNHTIANLNKA